VNATLKRGYSEGSFHSLALKIEAPSINFQAQKTTLEARNLNDEPQKLNDEPRKLNDALQKFTNEVLQVQRCTSEPHH
jgi:hypothetical protein